MKSKWFRASRWAFGNFLLAAALWLGFVEGVEGARNVGIFACWAFCFLAFCVQLDGAVKANKAVLLDPSVPVWLDVLYDLFIMGLLVWHGAIWTGIGYFAHFIFLSVARQKAKELDAEPVTA